MNYTNSTIQEQLTSIPFNLSGEPTAYFWLFIIISILLITLQLLRDDLLFNIVGASWFLLWTIVFFNSGVHIIFALITFILFIISGLMGDAN